MSARKAAAGDGPYLLPDGWRWVKLGEVLTQSKEEKFVADPREEKLISVKLYGKGAVRRKLKDGKEPAAFKGFIGHSGQLVFSRIWARRGAIAIIPEDLDGVVVTNEFPIFNIDRDFVDVNYLEHYVSSSIFIQSLSAESAGASGQNRVRVNKFISMEIPLPPLPEQRRIAEILNRAQGLRKDGESILRNLSELVESEFGRRFSHLLNEVVKLGDVINLTSGKSIVSKDQEVDSPYKVLKISSVTSGNFKSSEVKQLPHDYVPPAEHLIRHGDLLMSRANTAELVGATAYVDSTPENIALPDKVWKFQWKIPGQDPIFYHSLLSSAAIRHKISELASGSGGSMKNISKSKLLSMEIPRVGVGEQREYSRFVEYVHERRRIVEGQIKDFSDLSKSLQSRAFRGEL